MILIDSSIWISYFKNSSNSGSNRFQEIIDKNLDMAIIPMVLSEVLAGFKYDADYKEALKIMVRVPQLPVSTDTYIEAAQLYRSLRKKGVTVRGLTDCLIAQVCLNLETELMTLDKDFKKIANHTKLKLLDI